MGAVSIHIDAVSLLSPLSPNLKRDPASNICFRRCALACATRFTAAGQKGVFHRKRRLRVVNRRFGYGLRGNFEVWGIGRFRVRVPYDWKPTVHTLIS